MSTESETKSAGVPAGATQQCAACGQYWNDADWPIPPFTDLKCRCDDVRPIAEAGPAPTTAETPALPQARACIHGAWNCQTRLWANGRPVGELTAHYLAAPTTAAPAEQLSGKVVCESDAHLVADANEPHRETQTCVKPRPAEQPACVNPYHLKSGNHDGKTCYSIRTTPAEQPGKAVEGDHADDCTDPNCHKRHTIPAGKAADPRPANAEIEKRYPTPPGELTRDEWRQVIPLGIDIVRKLSTLHLRTRPAQPQAPVQTYQADAPEHLTISSAFGSVQPQAPAEPTQEQLDAADAWCESLPGQGDLVELLAQYAEHVAAPLREERDRLAGELADLRRRSAGDVAAMDEAESALAAERAKVAARDARIETLENELRGVLRHVEREAEEHAQAAIKIRAALGAPEGQPRNDEVQIDPSLTPEQIQRGSDEDAAAMLAEEMHERCPVAPEGQPPAAPPEAPLDALREALKHVQEELRDGFIVCSSCGHEEPTGDLDVLTVHIDPALSAPPPPPREQELLGKEGGDGEAGALLRELGVEASGGRVHVVKHWLAAASAPPRKAPQEGRKACALVAKEFGTDKCPWCGRPFGTTVGYVEKCSAMHHAVRSAMGLDKPAYDARPSSPEEQLSGKELK